MGLFARSRLLAAGAILLASVAIMDAAPAAAQGQAGIPAPVVAVIDLERVLRESSAARGVRAERDRYAQTLKADLAARDQSLRQAEQELAKSRGTLTQEQFTQKRREFEQQVVSFQREVAARGQALDASYGKAMAQVQKTLIEVTDSIAQANNVNLVLFKTQAFLFSPKMDISEQAVAKLNQQLPSVAFPAPEAAPAAKKGKK